MIGSKRPTALSVRQIYRARIIERQLLSKNLDLEKAISEIKQLSGIIPICASCKKIRDDTGFLFSHSLCPDCVKKLYPDLQPDAP